eukprot:8515215-Alexandrium_andersonii.AAC.1
MLLKSNSKRSAAHADLEVLRALAYFERARREGICTGCATARTPRTGVFNSDSFTTHATHVQTPDAHLHNHDGQHTNAYFF